MRMHTITRPAVALAAASFLLALAGCGGPSAAVAPVPTATTKPTAYQGETASTIAAMIPGCDDVQAGDVGKGGPDLASTASCVLNGRTLDVNSWSGSAAVASFDAVVTGNGDAMTYAAGDSWTVNVRRDPQLQWQVTNDAGDLIKYAMEDHPAPAADLPGEQEAARAVVKALGGSVVQVK